MNSLPNNPQPTSALPGTGPAAPEANSGDSWVERQLAAEVEAKTGITNILVDTNTGAEDSAVEADDEPEVQQDEDIEDLSGNHSRRGEYSQSDIVAALDFAQHWRAATEEQRSIFSELMGVWGNQAEIIFGLYPSGGRMDNIEFIAEIHRKNHDESMTRSDIRQWGIELASRISDMDPEKIRSITKMLNALTSDDYPELRYRRNMSSLDTIDLVSDAIDSLDSEALETLQWASRLVAIWPGQVQ